MASSSSNSPCAACKFVRRKCTSECVFSPYFPPEEPQKFVNVHRIFGVSNVTKLLNDLAPNQRENAVNSLAYEAEARIKDPVYGCVGTIAVLQRQVQHLQKELAAAHADLLHFTSLLAPEAAMRPAPYYSKLGQNVEEEFPQGLQPQLTTQTMRMGESYDYEALGVANIHAVQVHGQGQVYPHTLSSGTATNQGRLGYLNPGSLGHLPTPYE